MPLTTNAIFKENDKFVTPFRMILSGSSGSGKTAFAGKILEHDVFDTSVEYVYYYFPCYLDEAPVDWHNSMTIPVSYQTGLPTLEQLTSMPANSVVILDDLMDECVISGTIDHLFRVISGKRKISVMIMTQNYFTHGRYSRNIRNSCNFTVLLRNYCDATINNRAARAMKLTKPVALAEQWNADKEYPYIFIDQTQKGQVSGYQIYTSLFDRYKKCYSNTGMPSYIIPEKDFSAIFHILQRNNRVVLAQQKNEDEINEHSTGVLGNTIVGTGTTTGPVTNNDTTTVTANITTNESISTQPREYSRKPKKRTRCY